MTRRRWPAGLAENGIPRFVRPVLAEDFSYLVRGPRRLKLARRSALRETPRIIH